MPSLKMFLFIIPDIFHETNFLQLPMLHGQYFLRVCVKGNRKHSLSCYTGKLMDIAGHIIITSSCHVLLLFPLTLRKNVDNVIHKQAVCKVCRNGF